MLQGSLFNISSVSISRSFVRDFTIVDKRGWNVVHHIAFHWDNIVEKFDLIKKEMTFKTLNLFFINNPNFGVAKHFRNPDLKLLIRLLKKLYVLNGRKAHFSYFL